LLFRIKFMDFFLKFCFQVCERIWIVLKISFLNPDVKFPKMLLLLKPDFFLVIEMQ